MAFTSKGVRPVFEAKMGPTRRFVVKGGVAFAVLDSGEPVFGFVVSAAHPRVEPCVRLSSHSVPLSVVPPQWFANAVDEYVPSMVDDTQWNYWATLVIASKTLGSNSGRIQLDEHHPFAQHTGVATLTVHGNQVEAANQRGDRVGVYTKPGIMHALTSQPGKIFLWSSY